MQFRTLSSVVTCAAVFAMSCSALAETPGTRSTRTLFLDDEHIAEMTGLKRVMHRPVKKGPVFLPRGETDGIRVQTASAPVWVPEENVFKLFYMGFPYRNHGWILGEIGSALAVSPNGLNWKRPVLNEIEIGGSTANNRFSVVDPNLRWGANKLMEVIYDPHDRDPSDAGHITVQTTAWKWIQSNLKAIPLRSGKVPLQFTTTHTGILVDQFLITDNRNVPEMLRE